MNQISFFNESKPHKMIIVEGMDNTGKTTLIGRLIRETGRGVLSSKVSLGPNQSIIRQMNWVEKEIADAKRGNNLMVYDRFLPICDSVYGPILRKGSLWSLNHLVMEQLLNDINPLVIYCRPDKNIICGFEDGRDQMEGVIENASELVDAYDKAIGELVSRGFDVIYYNFQNNDGSVDPTAFNFNEVSELVKKVIREYREM